MKKANQSTHRRKSITVQSPGRINIIGEHTDYNDGFVLPAAVDKKMTIHLRRNEAPFQAAVTAANLGETFSFDLQNYSRLESGWQNYIMGVVHELQKLGAIIPGFEAEFDGDVPIGGGMSSSAALECSFAYALNELFDLGFHRMELIKASQMAEHHFVGIKCGIMDQFASVMGKKGQVILLDCRTLEYHYYPLELGEHQLLLLNTNVSHALASSAYNTRRAECEEGVALLREEFPAIIKLRDINLEQLTSRKERLPERIFRRCHHIVSENQRVQNATRALLQGNQEQLGQLLYQSHFSLQNDFEVSCPELDFLVKATLDKEFILGSRMMGGGFGGCTINIIEKSEVDTFIDQISDSYREQFGLELTPYTVSIEDGTRVV